MSKEDILRNALKAAKEDEFLNQEELDAIRGGSFINISKDKCGDTNSGNCVKGCACTIIDDKEPKD